MWMPRKLFIWCILSCWWTGTTSKVYYVEYGSVLTIKPTPKYEINDGIIIQLYRFLNECDDNVTKYIWNGSHFLIGPVLTSYTGGYVMRLKNYSNMWQNHTFMIIANHRPHVQSQKVIVDEGDSINLTCTYQSNCNVHAVWTKNKKYDLKPVEKKSIAGNDTKVLTYILKNAEKHFAKKPYLCFLPEGRNVSVKLEVKEHRKPDVEKTSKTLTWFEDKHKAVINFSVLGSPPPNLTCIDEKTQQEILSCSANQMRNILYTARSKPCKSQNGRYVLSSRTSQTKKVSLWISKVTLEKDNGTILCRLLNSKGDQDDFGLTINVKVLSEVNVTIKSEQNTSYMNCVVRGNPPPQMSWERCKINETTRCEPVKIHIPKKKVSNESHTYRSSMLLDGTSHEHMINCKAKNTFYEKKGSYWYESNSKKTKVSGDNNREDDKGDLSNRNIFIVIGCVLLLLFMVAAAFVLYVKERSRNIAYKKFFLANNNYSIDPLKSLNEQMHHLSYDEDWEFPYMYLTFNELIGCGAFGKVYKAEAYGIGLLNSRDKSTHAKKQRKQLNKSRNKMKLVHSEENQCITVAVKTTKDNPDVNDIRNLAGELKMIIHVGQHENIVNVLGACTKYPKLYMIIEYCLHGSLLAFLRTKREIFQPTWSKEDFASKERFTIANLISTAIQVCNGMRFLASKKCIHRDLAARNVLVTDNYVMKVADFGMAREVLDTDNYVSNTHGYLPVKWMALESILEKVYTEESDVWSFGILLWEMFTLGQTPYPSIPVQQLVEFLSDCARMEKPKHCPPEVYLIMLDCWNQNPKERPSFAVLYGKLQQLLQVNIIEDSGIDVDNNYDEVLCTETDIF